MSERIMQEETKGCSFVYLSMEEQDAEMRNETQKKRQMKRIQQNASIEECMQCKICALINIVIDDSSNAMLNACLAYLLAVNLNTSESLFLGREREF